LAARTLRKNRVVPVLPLSIFETVEEWKMRNWFEMYMFGREKAFGLTRQSKTVSRAPESTESVGRDARPEQSTTVVGGRATFVLQRNEVISIRARRRWYRVSCVAGRLWVTVDERHQDALLCAGEAVTYREGGRIVIQALRTATVRIEREPQAVPSPSVSADSQPRMAFFLSGPSA
jgi:Protein of unknown function (DUF2917)